MVPGDQGIEASGEAGVLPPECPPSPKCIMHTFADVCTLFPVGWGSSISGPVTQNREGEWELTGPLGNPCAVSAMCPRRHHSSRSLRQAVWVWTWVALRWWIWAQDCCSAASDLAVCMPVELGSSGPCWAQSPTAHAGSAGLREMKRVSWGQHVAPHSPRLPCCGPLTGTQPSVPGW